MSRSGYLSRYKDKLLARGDKWRCFYCRKEFVPTGVRNGTKPYYTDHALTGRFLSYDGGAAQPEYAIAPRYSDRPSIDHVIPVTKGGTNDLDNLVFACFQCNGRKGNRQ